MSTTTNLKLFKHDNPTTNTDQFDVEKALNENWDKLDANAGEVASKIQTLEDTINKKDTLQDTEIEALKAENTLLKSQIPSATVVGESIHLEDSSNMQCQIMTLGASKQETREGYNLLDTSKFEETTSEGVTLTKNEDGTIVLNGTATGSILFRILRTGSNIVATGDETITINQLDGTISGGNLKLSCQTTDYTDLVYSQIGTANVTNKLKAGVTYNIFTILIDEGTICTNLKLGLVISSSETEYEQYGASPSIEFEAPIESVGDNINILENTATSQTINGVEFIVNSDGSVMANGTATKNTYLVLKENLSLSKGGYALSGCPSGGTSTTYRLQLYSATAGSRFDVGEGNTFTLDEDTVYDNCRISIANGATINNLVFKPKLEKGSKATPYSPYGQGSIEVVNSNKNLLNLGNDTFVSNGLNIVNEISKITVTGTLTASWATGSKSKSCLLKAGTYTFSIDKPLTHHIYLAFTFEDSTTRTLQINRDTLSNKITTDKNIIKYNIGFSGVTSGETYNEIIYLQLEKGSTATEYTEHQSSRYIIPTQQPLKAIGEVKDRFVKKDGIWYEEHKIGRYIFTGNENWMKNDSWTNQNAFFGTVNWNPKLVDGFVTIANLICSHLTIVTPHKVSIMSGSAIGQGAGNTIYISMEGVTTSAELKAKLSELYNAGTPVIVDYVLAEPLLILCTVEQVEVLESFYTYKNITNISSDSIGELEVFYYKDLETLLGGA